MIVFLTTFLGLRCKLPFCVSDQKNPTIKLTINVFSGDILCSHNFCNTLVIHAIRNPGNCVATSLETEKSEAFSLKVPLDKG